MRHAIFAALLLTASPALAGTLTMTGQGEAKAAPDQVAISAGVTTTAPTAAAALAANTAKMRSVFAALARLGVPDKDLQTDNFSVSPQYASYNSPNNDPPHLTGYQVSNQVRVLLEDVNKLGIALDALVTAGANQMNGISFSIRDPGPLLTEARGDAVADARARAQTYAKAAGVQLGAIQSISEGGAEMPRPVMYAPMMMKAAGAVPVAAGQESVSASVSIVWEIH